MGIGIIDNRLVLIPERTTRRKRRRARILNRFLMLFFLPVFALGAFGVMNVSSEGAYENDTAELVFYYAGLIIGIVLHELAHGAACRAYRGRVEGYGLLLFGILGAYTLMDTRRIKSGLKLFQIDLAGIECNLLLTGLFWGMIIPFKGSYNLLFSAGAANIILALFNCLCIGGLDGMQAVKEMLWENGMKMAIALFACAVLTIPVNHHAACFMLPFLVRFFGLGPVGAALGYIFIYYLMLSLEAILTCILSEPFFWALSVLTDEDGALSCNGEG